MAGTKTLGKQALINRVVKAIKPFREEIESVLPRPKSYPYHRGWGLAFDVEVIHHDPKIKVIAWSLPPTILLPFDEMIKRKVVPQPWTDYGHVFFDQLRMAIYVATGIPPDITYVTGIWEFSGTKE